MGWIQPLWRTIVKHCEHTVLSILHTMSFGVFSLYECNNCNVIYKGIQLIHCVLNWIQFSELNSIIVAWTVGKWCSLRGVVTFSLL